MDCVHWWGDTGGEVHSGPADVGLIGGRMLDAHQTEWAGLAMRSQGQVVLVVVEAAQLCCEELSVQFARGDPRDLIGATLQRVELNVRREQQLVNAYKGFTKDRHCLCVDIYTTADRFELDLVSDHNGYYAHEVQLVWPGHRETTQL